MRICLRIIDSEYALLPNDTQFGSIFPGEMLPKYSLLVQNCAVCSPSKILPQAGVEIGEEGVTETCRPRRSDVPLFFARVQLSL